MSTVLCTLTFNLTKLDLTKNPGHFNIRLGVGTAKVREFTQVFLRLNFTNLNISDPKSDHNHSCFWLAFYMTAGGSGSLPPPFPFPPGGWDGFWSPWFLSEDGLKR